jgi:HSP20 family protein
MEKFFEDKNEQTALLTKSKTQNENKPEGQLTVDVYQTEDEIIILSTIAGVNQNDIDITVTNEMVIIKGKRSMPDKIKDSDYYYQEIFWGPFSRTIILPEDIDSENAKASMQSGLLTIRLPKLTKIKTKTKK